MLSIPLRRKVLVLNDKKSVRNVLVLLKRIGGEGSLTSAGEPLQALDDDRQFEAVVLDMRSSEQKKSEEIRGIGEVRVGRAGKLLVIIAEVNGPQTMDLLERYTVNGLPETLLWLVSHRYKPRRQ